MFFSFVLLIFVSVAIIVGSVMLYNGAHEFTKVTGRASSFVMRQAKNTIYMLTQVSETVAASRSIAATHLFSGFEVLKSIDSIRPLLDFTASSLAGKTNQYSHYISDLVLLVRLSLIILATLTLLLMVGGSLCTILGRRSIVFIFVVVGWILVGGTFAFSGVFLSLHNAVTDTCFAINQWVETPTAHTVLDDLLPCVDNAAGYQTLLGTTNISFQLVNVINRVITNVSNAKIPSTAVNQHFYNQTGPLLPLLCNPYHSDMSDRECAAGEVNFMNATRVWKKYICKVSVVGSCATEGRLTPHYHKQMSVAVNATFGLYHFAPFLIEAKDCTQMRAICRRIHNNDCHELKEYLNQIYIGLLTVSVSVTLLLILWIPCSREQRHRINARNVSPD